MIDYLTNKFFICESWSKSVFHCIKFRFVLHGKSFSGIIVSLSFSSSSEFCLETFEIGVIFIDFYESHFKISIKYLLIFDFFKLLILLRSLIFKLEKIIKA